MAASLPAGLNSSAQPSPLPPRTSAMHNTSPPSTFTPRALPEDIRKEVEDEIRNLHSENQIVLAKAAAALVMLATLPGSEPYLLPAVSRLSLLLENVESIHVQRNACAALTAIMNASLSLYIAIAESPFLLHINNGFIRWKGFCNALKMRMVIKGFKSMLLLQEEGLQIIKTTDVAVKLLSLLEHAYDVRLEEEITDAVCELAVHEEMRQSLVLKGAVSKLASKLTTGCPEICVRVLLGLGMLCGSSEEGQVQITETDGAIATLLSLMKSNDQDIRAIARDLCASLSSNERVKLIIEQLLRSNSATGAN